MWRGKQIPRPKGVWGNVFPHRKFCFRSGGIVGKGEAPLSRERKRRLRVSAKKHGGQASRARRTKEIYKRKVFIENLEGSDKSATKGVWGNEFPHRKFCFRSGGIVGKGEAPLSRERQRRRGGSTRRLHDSIIKSPPQWYN